MILPLLIGAAAVAATVLLHYFGTVYLSRSLMSEHSYVPERRAIRESVGILFVVSCLLVLHFAEIAIYAAIYFLAGLVSDGETALYFSMATFTTIGFGDVVLKAPWRLISTIEGANGLMLFGWSTAFLTSFLSKVRSIQAVP